MEPRPPPVQTGWKAVLLFLILAFGIDDPTLVHIRVRGSDEPELIGRRLLAAGVFYRAGQGLYRLLKLQPDEWVCEQPRVGLAGRFGADWPVRRGRGAVAVFTARGLARPELSTLFHRR